jgi:hypothetical protein
MSQPDTPVRRLRFIFPVPWADRPGQVIFEDGEPYLAGFAVRRGLCDRCGDPLAGLGLLEACRDNHDVCRGCARSFDEAGGPLLQNPGRTCRRQGHNKPKAA